MQVIELPPSDTVRWSPHRKASVVRGVRSGAISLEEACRRYQLSSEEFQAWQEALEAHGLGALRVSRSQYLRRPSRASRASPMSAARTTSPVESHQG
jgi:transposase-like protein